MSGHQAMNATERSGLYGQTMRRWSRAIGLGIFALTVAGCEAAAPWGADLGDYQAAPRDLLGVQSIAGSHVVRLAGRDYVGRLEREKLGGFIAGIGENRPESLRIALRGPATRGQLRAVAELLVTDGVDPRHIVDADPRSAPPAPRGTVAVLVERAIAIPPNCPGWVDHTSAPGDNVPHPNLGCADVSNFAAMVGDPHHLTQGASTIYHDGERGALSVTAYRTDKVKDLPPINQTFTVK
jgi:pilus biogenesis lipoprotein CpaD